MVDKLSPERRSWNMSRIRSGDTHPELKLRSLLHKAGYRFRLRDKLLPGKPDIILPKYKTVIFVHGCYWHRHANCKKATSPKINIDFWQKKFETTVERDKRKENELKNLGWNIITVWECQLENNSQVVMDEVDKLLKERQIGTGT